MSADRKIYSTACDLRVTLAMDWPDIPVDLPVIKRQAAFKRIPLDLAEHLAEEFKTGLIGRDGKLHGKRENYVCHSIRRNVAWIGRKEPIPPGMTDQDWEW